MSDTNPDNSDRDDMISQFSDITGASADRASFYLGSANWTLQLALASFYEQDDNEAEDEVENIASGLQDSPVPAQSVEPSSNESSLLSHFAAKGAEKKVPKKPLASSGPRIATIHNMTKDSDDEDEQGQAFYTGGSERSGQQILGPPKKNPMRDYVSDVFSSARANGAQVVDQPHSHASTSSGAGSSPFVGTGYRLGQTNDDHVTLPGTQSARSRPNIDVVVLKLWHQGFSINDGDLRPYQDPANKEFLESIMKGEIPQELRGDSMVHVDLEDHRNEEFVKAAVKVKPFAGKGHTLGSPAPMVVSDATASAAATAAQASAGVNFTETERSANEELNVDAAQPSTMIQVRLADGSRLSTRFNNSHTVQDIRNFITRSRPQYAAQNFALLTTFPNKELQDASETIEKAGLLNAAILQRLK